MKLVVRQRNVQGEGVGRVISSGVYFMLHAYVEMDEDRVLGMAGENVSSARPFVGVVWD
jgi:hypothetical protein